MERNLSIDIAKGLGIILVMIGHLNVPFWIINVIYFFHMPLFIIISGYFHKKTDIRRTINSGRKVILSYFFYGMFFWGFSFLIGNGELEKLIPVFLFQPQGIWEIPFFGVFWFIIALLVIKGVASFYNKNYYIFIASIISFFVVSILAKKFTELNNLSFALGQVLILFCFYIFGAYLKNISLKNYKIYLLISSIAFTVLATFSIYYYGGFNSKIVNFHALSMINPVITILMAVTGSVLIFTASFWLSQFNHVINKLLCFIGEYSFTFYAVHLFMFFLTKRILNLILPFKDKPEITFLIPFFLLL